MSLIPNFLRKDQTWLNIVEAKEKELKELYDRQDADEEIREGKKYTMRNLLDTADMAGVANVTSPEPSLFMNKTIARVAAVEWQTVILADKKNMSDTETTFIENFVEDSKYEINSHQNRRGEVSPEDFHSDMVCSRGMVGEQILTREEGGIYIPDVRSLDTRYIAYEIGGDSFLWCSVRTWGTKEKLEDEFELSNLPLGRSPVVDIYYRKNVFSDKKKKSKEIWNIVYIGTREVRHQKTPYKRVPFTLQIVPAGSVTKGEKTLKHKGEGIFENLRDVFPEDNFILSTLKTLNYSLFKPPVQMPTKGGIGAEPPDKHPADTGQVTMTEIGAPIAPVFTPDIRQYTVLFNDRIRSAMDRAGYSSIDFGQTDDPLSFLAMQKLAQGKWELLTPRLKALRLLYQDRYKMVIEQYIDIGETLELGEEGHRREYNPKKLEGKYTIKFDFSLNDPTELASLTEIALKLKSLGLGSEDYIRREVLKFPNPDGEKVKESIERVEATNPFVRTLLDCENMIAEGRDEEAKALRLTLLTLIGQIGVVQQPGQSARQTQGSAATSLLSAASNRGGPTR